MYLVSTLDRAGLLVSRIRSGSPGRLVPLYPDGPKPDLPSALMEGLVGSNCGSIFFLLFPPPRHGGPPGAEDEGSMGLRGPPETGGPVGIPTVAGLVVRVYVSFAERGMEKLFLFVCREGECAQ